MKYLKLIMLLLVLLTSCLKENNYDIPPTNNSKVTINKEKVITFNSVINRYNQAVNNGETYLTFTENEELYIEGYVISDDNSGNFYKELIIQNKTDDSTSFENPRLGLKLIINDNALSNYYNFGRKVYIQLAKPGYSPLSISKTNGVYTIGYAINNNVEFIPKSIYKDCILRTEITKSISPKITDISELNVQDLCTYITLKNVQFTKEELGKTYAGEASDEYDGLRELESCTSKLKLNIETSAFANFKSLVINNKKGELTGVYNLNYFGDSRVFNLNSIKDVNFSETENRCDPETLNCNSLTLETPDTNIFYEDFENNSFEDLENLGWQSVNLYGGKTKFKLRKRAENSYMECSAYNSNEENISTWLISPLIDLSNSNEETLAFKTKAGYYNGSALKIYISKDYDRNTNDINNATWILLDANIANQPSNGYGEKFTQSGVINISCLDKNASIGFHYTGSVYGATTTFQIDDIILKGK
jgi:hypothetical protein